MVSLIIGGDLAPVGRNESLFACGDAEAIYHDLLPVLQSANFVVANLECPLVEHGVASTKTGPSLKAAPDCAAGIMSGGIGALCLANNHILDYGVAGLESTVAACTTAGIRVFGAGQDLLEAQELLVCQISGCRIAFWGMAEHEWSVADETAPGANPLEVMAFRRMVRDKADKYDFLVVLVHGGKEHYPYPTPRLMDTCRFLAEEGAGAIVCQHTHSPGCYEIYGGVPIVYGQGNFIFDSVSAFGGAWHEGFLVQLEVHGPHACEIRFLPFVQSLDTLGVHRLNLNLEREFLANLDRRSEEIQTPGFVTDNWRAHCLTLRNGYIRSVNSYRSVFNALANPFLLDRLLHHPMRWHRLLNLVRCETHREVLETILNEGLAAEEAEAANRILP